MQTATPQRSEIEKRYTWNSETLFTIPQAWEAEVKSILESIPTIKKFEGKLSESASTLADALETCENLMARMVRAYVYAGFSYSVDTADQSAATMQDRAQTVYGQLGAAAAFLTPELLSIGRERIDHWVQGEPRLKLYRQYVDNLFRTQAHVRSAEVEEVLGMLADPFSGPSNTAGLLTNADFKFQPARDAQGNEAEVSEATFWRIMSDADRSLRQTTWESYMDKHLEFKNTLASTLTTSIKQNVLLSRVRRHSSALEMALFAPNIPVDVFHNLIETFKKHLPIWQRYFEIRRKALGVETLEPYDMWAP